MRDQEQQPIIIVKKKGGHGGHHGGAWKVAYADFVTAMMALFIVLWLLSSDEKVKKAVGGYFQDPAGVGKMMGSDMAGTGDGLSLAKDDMKSLKERIEQALKKVPVFNKLKDNIQIQVTGEGLRIELLENELGTFFDSGNANPTVGAKDVLKSLAEELGKLPNHVVMEGHTDAKPFAVSRAYTNWELSADRANAARRLMVEQGLREEQLTQVRGFAATRPRKPDPLDPSNRRITVIVQYLTTDKNAAGADAQADTRSQEAKATEAKSDKSEEEAKGHGGGTGGH
jgi:chemotaxis protein MotB